MNVGIAIAGEGANTPPLIQVVFPDGKPKITEIHWFSRSLFIKNDPTKTQFPDYVEMAFKLTPNPQPSSMPHEEYWSMTLGKVGNYRVKPNRLYRLKVPLTPENETITITLTSPTKETQTEVIQLKRPKTPKAEEEPPKSESKKESPPSPPARLLFAAGIGPTFLSYREDVAATTITEFALTGKGGVTWAMIPNRFDLSVGGFATLLPFLTSPSETTSCRFYGINFRGTLTLGPDYFDHLWGIGVGPYFWSMYVSDQSYGVSGLKGMQIYLQNRTGRNAPVPYSLYFKFAPISDKMTEVGFVNSEIALGGSVQISARDSKSRWLGTWDLARARFFSETDGNGMRLYSFSLGITKPF